MVRINIPSDPDALDIDLLSILRELVANGNNYPQVVYNKLRTVYRDNFGKGLDDQTVRRRLEDLYRRGYLDLKEVGGRRFYFPTPGADLLLRSTLVIEKSSGQTSVFLARACDTSLPPRVSVVTDKGAEIKIRDNSYEMGYGMTTFPLPDDAATLDVNVADDGFARIKVTNRSISGSSSRGRGL